MALAESGELGPGALERRLAALPVRVETARVQAGVVPLAAYPGGWRPTSTIRLTGAGEVGLGENVAFETAFNVDLVDPAHAAFVALGARIEWTLCATTGARTVAEAMSLVGLAAFEEDRAPELRGVDQPEARYARAAVEAALIDLGLRQAGLGLAAVTGRASATRLGVVVSFDGGPDPIGHIRRLRSAGYSGGLKIDVDPSWSASTQQALATEPGIVILDFKGRGDGALVAALSRRFPEVIFEDPPGPTWPDGRQAHPRCASDAPIVDSKAAAAALARGDAINLKAPRMGGPLAVLRALELVRRQATTTATATATATATWPRAYLGGMFEIGVGRRQARALAALFCPDAPNDLAPHDLAPAGPPEGVSEAVEAELANGLFIRLDQPGFG